MPIKLSPQEDIPALNLTSMIDVLFLLIIFFMVGTKFVESERQIELELPRVDKKRALTAPPDKKLVNIYRDGQIELDHQIVSLQQLTARLTAARDQYHRLGVLVRGDGSTPLDQLAGVLNACRQAGIADLGISVRLAGTERSHAQR